MISRSGRVVHHLTGPSLVAHDDDCGCDFVRSVRHAPWISYTMYDGTLRCYRCGDAEIIPTPSIRVNTLDKDCKEVYMDHDAIVGDLERFKQKHQDCAEPMETLSTSDGNRKETAH